MVSRTRRDHPPRRESKALAPRPEDLESRALLATFTVVNTRDGGPGSLRQAILNANRTPGSDAIDFAIPGRGVHAIRPITQLPSITDAVTIDGYSQRGSRPNTDPVVDNAIIAIELVGGVGKSPSSAFTGLTIGQANGVTVQGLAIGGFPSAGISVGFPARNVVIRGNFLGTDASGKVARPNQTGLYLQFASGVAIGGTDPASRNVISGNADDGIDIFLSRASGVPPGTTVTVQGNFIGTDASGKRPLGNDGDGVKLIGSSYALIGGPEPGARNVIAANGLTGGTQFLSNHRNGVEVTFAPGIGFGGQATPSEFNVIQNNVIGTDLSGRLDLGNVYNGVLRQQPGDTTTIVGNVIRDNGALSIYTPPTAAEFATNDLLGNKDQVVNLNVSLQVSTQAATVGQSVAATVVVNNPSSAAAQPVVLTVSITGVAITSVQPGAPGTSATWINGAILLGTIPAGGSATVLVRGVATNRAFGVATASVFTTTFEPDTSNNMAGVPFSVIGPPHIVGLAPISAGRQIVGVVLTADGTVIHTDDLRNFAVATAGPDGRFGTADDAVVPIASSTYDPDLFATTLRFPAAFPAGTLLRVVVDPPGSPGVTDLGGTLLDGDNQPGGAFDRVTTLGPKLTYLDHDGDRITLRLSGGGQLGLVMGPSSDALAITFVGIGPRTRGVLTGNVRRNRAGGDGRTILGSFPGFDRRYVASRLNDPPFLGAAVLRPNR